MIQARVLSPWRRQTPPLPFSPMEEYTGQGSGRMSTDVEIVSLLREPRTKDLGNFMDLGVNKRAGRKG